MRYEEWRSGEHEHKILQFRINYREKPKIYFMQVYIILPAAQKEAYSKPAGMGESSLEIQLQQTS